MRSLALFGLVFVAVAAGAFEVENVRARSRWPWNGLIDIDYEITGAKTGESFAIDVTATYGEGQKLTGRTYCTDPVGAGGANSLVWDFGADCPNVIATNLALSVTATPFGDATTVYMVIDVAGGKDATKYPVRYTTTPPQHTPKCTNDVCKLTEIWLRRVRPNSRDFTTLSYQRPSEENSYFFSRLTKDYYIGVFEITQQQWFQLTGTWPSRMSNETWRATRPLDRYYPTLLFGTNGYVWPDKTVKSGCLLDKLRQKTGLNTLNLPTEAQWRFALTAGPEYGREIWTYRRPDGSAYNREEICRQPENSGDYNNELADPETGGSALVGSYAPNNFGLYDMLGNVAEDCLDPYVLSEAYKKGLVEDGIALPATDFGGFSQARAKEIHGALRVSVGGNGFSTARSYHQTWQRGGGYTNYPYDGKGARGIRLCVTCE